MPAPLLLRHLRRSRAWGPAFLAALFLFGMLLAPAIARAQAPYAWVEADAAGQPRVHLYIFWSAHCPHCQQARPFIEDLPRQYPWISLHALEISGSRANLERYVAMAASLGQEARFVPAFLYCGRMQTGWHAAETSGAELLAGPEA